MGCLFLHLAHIQARSTADILRLCLLASHAGAAGVSCLPIDLERHDCSQRKHASHELVLWPQLYHWICRYVCDERWYNLTRSIRLRGLGFAGQDSLRQPTWCTLPPDKFHALSARTSQQQRPENILLIYKAAAKVQAITAVSRDPQSQPYQQLWCAFSWSQCHSAV